MELSLFGEKFTGRSGILELMDDLALALQGSEKKYMLGGGNPACIPEVNAVWRRRLKEILESPGEMERMLGNYDSAKANSAFADALAALLRREFGWPLTGENVAVTNGSQSACFLFYNLFGGRGKDGGQRRIVFPLCPEYIGYADQGIEPGQFLAFPSRIEELPENSFKYHVDFDGLVLPRDAAAIAVSRPTNPTGNVLSDEEVRKLAKLAAGKGIPLFLDNAYGLPFPRIIFEDVAPYWDENVIYSMSLSKLGLPSVRTGIIIARAEIVRAFAAANAIVNLANGGIGQILVEPLIRSGEILDISEKFIRPFYRNRSRDTIRWIRQSFPKNLDYAVHKSQGAIFLWIWFKNLSVSSKELYERLRKRNVIVVPGEYFFFGLERDWPHSRQCIRFNYAANEADVKRGIEIIAEETAKLV